MSNGHLDSRIQSLLDPLTREEESLKKELETLEVRRTDLRTSLQRIERIRVAAFPETRKTAKPGPKKKTPTLTAVSQERLDVIKNFVAANGPSTVRAAVEALRWSEPSVRAGLEQLRSQEVLRIAGKGENNASLYAMMES